MTLDKYRKQKRVVINRVARVFRVAERRGRYDGLCRVNQAPLWGAWQGYDSILVLGKVRFISPMNMAEVLS